VFVSSFYFCFCYFCDNCRFDHTNPLLFSAYGDGWAGNSLSVYDCEGNLVFNDYMKDGYKEVRPLCIPDDSTGGSFVYSAACDIANCNYLSEVSWTIYDSSKTAIASGGSDVASTTYGDCNTDAPTMVPTPCPDTVIGQH
jgi:hypothetical protein